jgi:hypothetical protein
MVNRRPRNVPLRGDAVRAAFRARSVGAIERIMAEAPVDALAAALAAPTDVGTLAMVIGDPELVGEAVGAIDPLASLLARSAGDRMELLAAAGGTLSAAEVARVLGISRQGVDKRRRAFGLLAVRLGGDWRYPACQLDERAGEVVAGVPEVVGSLRGDGPWASLDFLLAPDTVLGGLSPIQALRAGDREGLGAVLRLARAIEVGDGFS